MKPPLPPSHRRFPSVDNITSGTENVLTESVDDRNRIASPLILSPNPILEVSDLGVSQKTDYLDEDSNDSSIAGETLITKVLSLSDVDWKQVCADKTYVPREEDVGCLLRVTVSAHAVSDNSLLTQPFTLVTESVLANPKPPPKRPFIMIPGALSGASSTVIARFRVLSYNVLSELYATKQVSCKITIPVVINRTRLRHTRIATLGV